MLHRIIELINSYEEVEEITIDIGMCIGEITSPILDALCNITKKIVVIGFSSLLVKHTCEQAIEVFTRLRNAIPKLLLKDMGKEATFQKVD